MKCCYKCKEVKSISDFSFVKGKPYSYCRKCKARDDKEYAAKNKEKVLLKAKIYRESNKSKVYAKVSEWHSRNKGKIREYKSKWKKNNPECARAHEANRRSKLRKSTGCHSMEDIKNIFKLQLGKCAFCKEILKPGYHVDHIIPLALNGSNSKENIQLLCAPCNVFKGAKDPIVHAREIGRLI